MTDPEIVRNILCIRVRKEGEWADFFVQEAKDGDYFRCQLTINSSYGAYGHIWGSMGCPASRFFDSTDKHYFLNKLWGEQYQIFNGDAATISLKRELFRQRRNQRWTRGQARDAYNALGNIPCATEFEFFNAVYNDELLFDIAVYGDINTKIVHPGALRFWDLLWHDFVRGLQRAREQEADGEVTA